MFSQIARTLHGDTNPLYRLRAEVEGGGAAVLDLVSANVTEQGILFPADLLESILLEASRASRVYRPDSFGQRAAREAIAAYYARGGVAALRAENLLLTPGTSISYWYCFKLLADPGDEMLCPRPGYPLFNYISALSGVRMVPYPLDERHGWKIDLERLEASISTRTRGIILISPHNPTGHVSTAVEISGIADIARRHDLAVLSDEVFHEFQLEAGEAARPASSEAPLVFTLNGFSKMFALPGLKLGWLGVTGEPERVAQALRALELISDTFLPVAEVAQAAVGAIFEQGEAFLSGYVAEIRRRWQAAREVIAGRSSLEFVPPGGGFYVTLRLNGVDEEKAVEALLRRERILVHPGYFYDLEPDHLIASFTHIPGVLTDAFARLVGTLQTLVS